MVAAESLVASSMGGVRGRRSGRPSWEPGRGRRESWAEPEQARSQVLPPAPCPRHAPGSASPSIVTCTLVWHCTWGGAPLWPGRRGGPEPDRLFLEGDSFTAGTQHTARGASGASATGRKEAELSCLPGREARSLAPWDPPPRSPSAVATLGYAASEQGGVCSASTGALPPPLHLERFPLLLLPRGRRARGELPPQEAEIRPSPPGRPAGGEEGLGSEATHGESS